MHIVLAILHVQLLLQLPRQLLVCLLARAACMHRTSITDFSDAILHQLCQQELLMDPLTHVKLMRSYAQILHTFQIQTDSGKVCRRKSESTKWKMAICWPLLPACILHPLFHQA